MIPLALISTLVGALVIFRGLKNELLCTENPSTGEQRCSPYSSYTEERLVTLERDGVKNW